MAETSTSLNNIVREAIETLSPAPIETGENIQGDVLHGISEAPSVEAVESPAAQYTPSESSVFTAPDQPSAQETQQQGRTEFPQRIQQPREIQEARSMGTQPQTQARTQAQPQSNFPQRPSSVASDIASTMGVRQGQQSVPYSPLQSLMTPSQSQARVDMMQEADDIRRDALATMAMQDANMMQGPISNRSTKVERGTEKADDSISVSTQSESSGSQAEKTPTQIKAEDKVKQEDSAPIGTTENFGVSEKRPSINPGGFINKLFKSASDRIAKKAGDRLKHFNPAGNSFMAEMLGDASVPPHCVSIGSENLLEAIREPTSRIIDLVNQETGNNLTVDECIADISLLVNAINNADIEVVLEKSPNNRRDSVQVRTLRAHIGVNIRIHPTQLKGYNADFDGDTGTLLLDQSLVNKYERAMSVIIGIDGKANIDNDFFPLDEIKTNARSEVLNLMIEKDFSWNDLVARAIIDEYIALANDPSNPNWVRLLRKIDEFANNTTNNPKDRQKLVSRIFASIYSFGRRRRMLEFEIASQNGGLSNQFELLEPPPSGTDPFITVLVDIQNEVTMGRPAPNMQEFAKMYSRFTGEPLDSNGMPTNKNVPFRLVADFGKAVKRSEFIVIGETTPIRINDNLKYISFEQLYKITCSNAMTRQISGRMHTGSHELRASTQLRDIMIREIGFPRFDEDFNEFLERFKAEYNYHVRMLEVAKNTRFRADMRISRDFKWDGVSEAKDIGKAFIDIYGDQPVSKMFPSVGRKSYNMPESQLRTRGTSDGILSKYLDMTLQQFAMNNKLDVNINDIEGNYKKNGKLSEMDVLLLVADRRRSDTQAYRTNWENWTEKMLDIIPDIQRSIVNEDYNRYSQHLLELMHLASPDMFGYFGMDDFQSFINSEWGQRLLLSRDVDSFRSTWVSMMIEYRMHKAMKIYGEKQEAADFAIETEDREKLIDAIDASYDSELRVLASSSFAWKAIIEEAREGNPTFNMLRNMTTSEMNRNGSKWKLNASSFWNSEESNKYGSLYALLKSDASYEDKMNALSDVVRLRENFKGIMSFEMIGQLAHNPNNIYEGSPFMMSTGLDTKPFKASIDKVTSMMSRRPRQARKFARKLVEDIRANEQSYASFILFLDKIANDPGFLVHIDPSLASDVMASVADKDYSDTEKIRQQQRVNGYFQSVSKMRTGGFYTHIQQTDNKQLNVIGFDQLTPLDLIRIIATPNETYYAYDEFGRMCELSRESICGGISTEAVIRFIEDNPQMAYLFRRYSANINDDTGKKSSTPGTASLRGIDNSFQLFNAGGDPRSVEQRAFSLFCDRPRFFALTALLTPVGLDTGRTLSGKYNNSINAMCNLLSYLAKFDGKQVPQNIVSAFEQVTGLSKDNILEATKTAKFDDGSGFDRRQAEIMYDEAIGEMLECVSLLASNGLVLDEAYEYDWGIDNNSVTSYYDVRQQFSGARTATMIGVEGAETSRNQMLKLYLNHRPDRFITIDENSSPTDITELSKRLNRNLRYEIEWTGPVTIDRDQHPDLADWVPSDPTLERNGRKQLQSIARFIEIKRESAAEEFNAKTKKFGDDGTNSVTKFDKFDYERAKNLREDLLTKTADRDEAIYMLAEALQAADSDLGYKKFPMSDYLNLADLMLVDDNGTLVIRTLEQISAAVRNRLSSEARYSGDSARMIAEIKQIVDTVGTSMDLMQASQDETVHELIYNSQRIGSGGSFMSDRAVLEHASSIERNYDQLQKFYKEFAETYAFNVVQDGESRTINMVPANSEEVGENERRFIPPNRKAINEMTSAAFMKLTNERLKEDLRGLVFPYMRYDDDSGKKVEDVNGKRNYSYDYLGKAGDPDLRLLPGPQNAVLFDNPNGYTQDELNTLEQCKRYGITAIFHGSVDSIPEDLQMDAQEIGNGLYIVPFFYMALNGATGEQLGPAPAQYQYHPTNYTVCVEETTGEVSAGDATAHVTQELGDRTTVTWGDTVTFEAEQLFPNVLETFSGDNYDFKVDFCTREEVQKYIINGFDDVAIDIGISPDNKSMFDKEMQKMRIRVDEYASRFEEANDVSFLTSELKDDRIAGFVKIIVNGSIQAFAPVIPFNRNDSGKVPRHYNVASLGYDEGSRSIKMAWRYEGDIRGQSVKFFEGIGASNKMMTNGDYIRSRSLANGLPVDVMYSTKSVASRLFASNKRINTLVSLMMMPRVDLRYAYNFADLADSFPGNPNLAEKLRNGTITSQEWFDILDSNQRFHNDEEINSVVKFIVQRCKDYGTVNPTTILANKFYDENGDSQIKFLTTEFEAFMDTSFNFQNGLMKLMNAMQPSLCPANVMDNSKNTLFKPNLGSGNDFGVLQMLVPHYMDDSDSEPFYVKENVYISPGFFGDVFSGFGRFNVDVGLSNQDLVVANDMSESALMQYAAIGAGTYTPVDQMLMRGMSVTSDSIMVDRFADALRSKRELGDEYGKILSLTGHRPDPKKDKLWGYDYSHPNYQMVKQKLKEFCEANGIDTIVSGMATGFDQLGAEAALEMGLKLVAAVPFKGQESRWPEEVKRHYYDILKKADKVKYVSKPGYSSKKMQIRNEWMVDNSDIVCALWDGSSGGTANCVDYALDVYANIARLDPKSDMSNGFEIYNGNL